MHKVWSLKDPPIIKVHRCRGCWHQATPPQPPIRRFAVAVFMQPPLFYVTIYSCARGPVLSETSNKWQRQRTTASSATQKAPFRGLSTPAAMPAALPLAHLVDCSWLAAFTCGELKGLHCTKQSNSGTAQQKNRAGNAIWQQFHLPAAALLRRCRPGLPATRSASPWPQCISGSYAAAA